MNSNTALTALSEAEIIEHVPGRILKLTKNGHTVEFVPEGHGWRPTSNSLLFGISESAVYSLFLSF